MSELIDRREFPEVLPCPFCGSKPKFFTMKRKGYVDIHYIECVNKKCNEPYSKAYDEEEVVKKWNTRHYPPEVEKAVEKMKPVSIKPEKTDEYHQCGDEFYLVRCPDCGKEFKLLGFKYSTDVRHCGCCGKAFTLDWSNDE